jgi:ADP-ribose pyrophosphatase YjhB (NUDIX family)
MIEALRAVGYDGVVYVPETEDGEWKHSYVDQVEWEQRYLEQCDVIVAWVPRDLETMPAFTTNVEFGQFLNSGKIAYGRPVGAPKTRYLDKIYLERGRALCGSIEELAIAAVNRIGDGAARSEGERAVPLDVWRTKQFQAWYRAQKEAGNRLDDAKLLWPFYVGPNKNFLFCFTLWVKVWIESEGRHKENEFIFSRTDISTIVAWRKNRGPGHEVLLVREFRSPARTKDGFIHELPGGSSFKQKEDPLEVASHELEEETSLRIDPSRFELHEARQVAGTLSTHHATVFSVELTDEEMDRAEELEKSGKHFGVEEDSERTYVEVVELSRILSERLLDWAQIGMLLEVLHPQIKKGMTLFQ